MKAENFKALMLGCFAAALAFWAVWLACGAWVGFRFGGWDLFGVAVSPVACLVLGWTARDALDD